MQAIIFILLVVIIVGYFVFYIITKKRKKRQRKAIELREKYEKALASGDKELAYRLGVEYYTYKGGGTMSDNSKNKLDFAISMMKPKGVI